eukprot:jgi/Bigna1/44176/e_gw1.90.33.1
MLPEKTAFAHLRDSDIVSVQVTVNKHDYSEVVYFTFEKDCPVGQFCSEEHHVYDCPAGAQCNSFRFGSRFDSYDLCPEGTYQPVPGQSHCKPCPSPFYCPNKDTRWQTPQPCMSGYLCYAASNGSMGFNACPEGYYCVNNERFLCSKGHYCPMATTKQIPCPVRTFNNMTGQPSCFDCPAGFICNRAALKKPVVCPRGWVCDRERLIMCPAGKWTPFRGVTDYYQCMPCPDGEV